MTELLKAYDDYGDINRARQRDVLSILKIYSQSNRR